MFPAINNSVRFPSAVSQGTSNPNAASGDAIAAVSSEVELPHATAIQECVAIADPALALPLDAQQTALDMRAQALSLLEQQPCETKPSVLAQYLTCPDNASRFRHVLEELSHEDLTDALDPRRKGCPYITTKDVPKELVQVSGFETILDFNLFTNSYSPDCWVMESNFREHKKVPYYASDVVLAQYHMMSQKYGFEGVLPKTIVRLNISNVNTLALFLEEGENATLAQFLTETPNGQHTQRVLDALQMKATRLEWDAEQETATIHVAPRS